MIVGTGGGRLASSPRQVKVWVNRAEGMSFDAVEATKSEQDFNLLEGVDGNIGSVEYPLRLSKFGNVRHLTMYFVSLFASILLLKTDFFSLVQHSIRHAV